MRFMIHWAVHSDKRKEVLQAFAETELEDLKGKPLAATMVSDQGSSEAAFQLP